MVLSLAPRSAADHRRRAPAAAGVRPLPLVEVVIPWAGACPHRAAALDWANAQYPWPVTVAEAPKGPWVKARAVMPAVAASVADVVIVADADVWTPGIHQAVLAVAGGAPWAVPHRSVRRLDAAATALVLNGERSDAPGLDWDEKPYTATVGGGIVVARRDVLLDVPLDPRFVGWGQEDEAWGIALNTIAGAAARGTHVLTHLWHPPQPRMSRRRGSAASWRLRGRYITARADRPAMRRLLEEARSAL